MPSKIVSTDSLSRSELLALYNAVDEKRRIALLDSLSDRAANQLFAALAERAEPVPQVTDHLDKKELAALATSAQQRATVKARLTPKELDLNRLTESQLHALSTGLERELQAQRSGAKEARNLNALSSDELMQLVNGGEL